MNNIAFAPNITVWIIAGSLLLISVFFLLIDRAIPVILKAKLFHPKSVPFLTQQIRNISGFIVLGFIPFTILYLITQFKLEQVGVVMPAILNLLPWLVIPSILIIGIAYLAAMKFTDRDVQSRLAVTGSRWIFIVCNFLFLTAYIIAYEFLFRGVLFFSLLDMIGFNKAMITVTVVYSAAHILKSLREALWSIPFGILLCYSAYFLQSFVVAAMLHLVLALSFEMASLAHILNKKNNKHEHIRNRFYRLHW